MVVEVPIGDYLASAARRGDLVTLARFNGYLDHVDADGRTVLMSACVARKVDVLDWALKQFKAVGDSKLVAMAAHADDYGCRPVHFAVAGGRLPAQPDQDCLLKLFEFVPDIDINAVDNAGFTPLLIAAQNG